MFVQGDVYLDKNSENLLSASSPGSAWWKRYSRPVTRVPQLPEYGHAVFPEVTHWFFLPCHHPRLVLLKLPFRLKQRYGILVLSLAPTHRAEALLHPWQAEKTWDPLPLAPACS